MVRGDALEKDEVPVGYSKYVALHGGDDGYGQCAVPSLEEGVTYIAGAAINCHEILLKAAGGDEACGERIARTR